MLKGLYRTVVDPRTRGEWRSIVARRLGIKSNARQRALDWQREPWFREALSQFDEAGSVHAPNRWNLYQLARACAHIPGDTAECGVFVGMGSYLICAATSAPSRMHFAFDSFAGLCMPSSGDGLYWQKGDLASPLEIAQARLKGFAVSYHAGWIPERFWEITDRSFAFVHIDVDLEQPTRDSLEFFYPRLNTNAILLCDDYGFSCCPGATKAVDLFFADKPEKIIALSSGGAFIVKSH